MEFLAFLYTVLLVAICLMMALLLYLSLIHISEPTRP